MITNFENFTFELNAYEINIVLPRVIEMLCNRKKKENAITSARMVTNLKKAEIKCNGPRMRKIIHHIRVNHLIHDLISSKAGYWIAQDEQELKKYLTGLEERIRSITELRESFNTVVA